MTDEEIKKALECCAANDCDECPLFDFPKLIADCMPELLKNAFYLINGQQAEIERLNEKITTKDESNYYFMGQLRTAREELQTAKSTVDYEKLIEDISNIGGEKAGERIMTQYEHIKNMSIDDMANFIHELITICNTTECEDCKYCDTSICMSCDMAKEWLESEVRE